MQEGNIHSWMWWFTQYWSHTYRIWWQCEVNWSITAIFHLPLWMECKPHSIQRFNSLYHVAKYISQHPSRQNEAVSYLFPFIGRSMWPFKCSGLWRLLLSPESTTQVLPIFIYKFHTDETSRVTTRQHHWLMATLSTPFPVTAEASAFSVLVLNSAL